MSQFVSTDRAHPIPRNIDIMGRIYGVYSSQHKWPGHTKDLHKLSGCHEWDALAIYINPQLSLTDAKATLLHEIIHSIIRFGPWGDPDNVRLNYESAEEVLEIIPTSVDDGLAYVLTHNPSLISWLAS